MGGSHLDREWLCGVTPFPQGAPNPELQTQSQLSWKRPEIIESNPTRAWQQECWSLEKSLPRIAGQAQRFRVQLPPLPSPPFPSLLVSDQRGRAGSGLSGRASFMYHVCSSRHRSYPLSLAPAQPQSGTPRTMPWPAPALTRDVGAEGSG